MMHRSVDASGFIARDPETVIDFIADIRNRQKYIPSLKSIVETGGKMGEVGHSWEWNFDALGRSFSGTAKATAYEKSKKYGFETNGGIHSEWTYSASPKENGTQLDVHVEYDVPDEIVAALPSGVNPEAMEQAEAGYMFEKLAENLAQ